MWFMTDAPVLGMKWGSPGDDQPGDASVAVVNTRTSLWPERWPAIALQECIDKVEAAPPEQQAQVKWDLPCKTCPMRTQCLNAKRKELGALMYDREILTSPRTGSSSLFPLELFQPMLSRTTNCVPSWRKPFSREHEYAVVQAWDLAWSEKTGGDWLVFVCGVIHRKSGRRRLLDIERWQRQSFGQQIALIEEKWKLFDADLVVIESDAAQRVWTQHMAETTAVPVVAHSAGGKRDLGAGVPGLLLQFENRKWEFPYAQGYHRAEMDVLLSEFEAFGWVDDKLQGVGEHDDTVMAFWHMDWGMGRFAAGLGIGEMRAGVQDGRYS